MRGQAQHLAIKTNMLYDAALIPNVGVEVALGKQWTASADWFGTWLSNDNCHRYWQGYGGYLTLRRYFGKHSVDRSDLSENGQWSMVDGQWSMVDGQGSMGNGQWVSGHHVGIYVLGLTYDVEWGGRGYQAARFGFGAGLEYGYALPIGTRLDLDFSIGLGFQDGEYKTYYPQDKHYVWESTRKRHWWGPTKAEVTLKWIIF